jgi:aryl-alcohol dehydrogenase-like predicted oxidoreductase
LPDRRQPYLAEATRRKSERPKERISTISGRKLGDRETTIPRRQIPGLGRAASVLALEFEDFRTFSAGSILLDAFYEAGGNLFDTAFVYGGGGTEALLGEWLKNRGVGEQSVVIGRRAHSPLCYHDVIGKQLTQSLDRLQTDYVDIYFVHRDNLEFAPIRESSPLSQSIHCSRAVL